MEYWAAAAYRGLLDRTVFIGVTGSAGKTMTKELIAAVLGTQWCGHRNAASKNELRWVVRTILATRPWHSFCVVEVGASGPGSLDRPLGLLRPRIAVVTHIGDDHRSAFRTPDATAREKEKLVAALPADGTAILNADDPRVAAMGAACAGRVITYGTTPEAAVRADEIRGAWPERLAFTVHHGGQTLPVQTRLCGTHWTWAVLAALATGVALGVPLERAVTAVGAVEPVPGRLSPLTDPAGVTFIRDEWKAPLWSMPSALGFLADARAPRKIAVIGTISDFNTGRSMRHVAVFRQARAIADHVVFVGPYASRGLRARRDPQDAAVRAFGTVRQASDYLQTLLRPGDLVLLKSSSADHIERIALRRTDGIACWLTRCGRNGLCDTCSLRWVAAGERPAASVARDGRAAGQTAAPVEAGPRQLIVGLGNPGKRYEETPHNMGRVVVDRLAERLGGRWRLEGPALVADVQVRDVPVLLVKLEASMNDAGPALKPLTDRFDGRPEDCIVVQNDMDLPVGQVRTRLKGGAGGHLGVRSILDTYQSEAFPRVKVGVGRPERSDEPYLLAPVSPERRALLDPACETAADRVLELVIELEARRKMAGTP